MREKDKTRLKIVAGWFRHAVFPFFAWLLAITLLSLSLLVASEFFRGKEATPVGPSSTTNPCSVSPANPCFMNRVLSNPCDANVGLCAVGSPSGGRSVPPIGLSPKVNIVSF